MLALNHHFFDLVADQRGLGEMTESRRNRAEDHGGDQQAGEEDRGMSAAIEAAILRHDDFLRNRAVRPFASPDVDLYFTKRANFEEPQNSSDLWFSCDGFCYKLANIAIPIWWLSSNGALTSTNCSYSCPSNAGRALLARLATAPSDTVWGTDAVGSAAALGRGTISENRSVPAGNH